MFKSLARVGMTFFVWMYQRTNGKLGGRIQGLQVLLLTTTGRRTGKQRTMPLGFFEYDGCYVITASNLGLDTQPGWFHNLISHPQVALQIRDKKLAAVATPADPLLRKQLWGRLMEIAPGYGAYQKRTSREIPIVLLRPVA